MAASIEGYKALSNSPKVAVTATIAAPQTDVRVTTHRRLRKRPLRLNVETVTERPRDTELLVEPQEQPRLDFGRISVATPLLIEIEEEPRLRALPPLRIRDPSPPPSPAQTTPPLTKAEPPSTLAANP